MARLPFAQWVAEQFRLTAFPLTGAGPLPAEQWWETLVGTPAEESAANLKAGSKTLAGTFHGGKLILKLEPGRIDWLLLPLETDPTTGFSGELPAIGPITENLEAFSEIATGWLSQNDLPDLIRAAFGAVVRHPEPDRPSAYIQLRDYLPFRIDPDSSDLNFQVNVPVASHSGVEGLRVNRLSRWSVMGLARLQLRIESSRVLGEVPQIVDHAIRLELDINTSQEIRGPLPRERLIEVYRELVSLGREIITEGLPQ